MDLQYCLKDAEETVEESIEETDGDKIFFLVSPINPWYRLKSACIKLEYQAFCICFREPTKHSGVLRIQYGFNGPR